MDRFNAVQGDVKVGISYQEQPSQAVLDGVSGDVVIGQWLASPAVMDRLDSLLRHREAGQFHPPWFYARFLTWAPGTTVRCWFLSPLPFPPLSDIRTSTDLEYMFMPLDGLQARCHDFNKASKSGTLTAVGFSPFWNLDFLTETALLFGAHFRPGRNGLPAFDQGGLDKTVEYAAAPWVATVNGGPAVDAAFASRNLVQPWYKLLSSGKTLFALTSFTEFFAPPEEKRRDFDFRWLSQDNLIPVMDNALFAGILRLFLSQGGGTDVPAVVLQPGGGAEPAERQPVEKDRAFPASPTGFSALKSIN